VLRLLRDVARTAKHHNRPLTVCGEMAGDPFYTMFLIGIGVDRLSMSSAQIPLVKKVIRSINLAGAERLVERAMQYSTTMQIRHLFQETVEQILGRDLASWINRGK
jgi:phosphotransferase system enzyme I (PtsI)